MAGLTFTTGSPEYKIEDFFPDNGNVWWLYSYIRTELVIEPVGANQSASSIYVSGGPINLHCSATAFDMCVNVGKYVAQQPGMAWYTGQVDDILSGAHINNLNLAMNQSYQYNMTSKRSSDGTVITTTGNISGSGATNTHVLDIKTNTNYWGTEPRIVFPISPPAYLSAADGYKIYHARDIIFNCKPESFFNGNVHSFKASITRVDGTTWSRTINFDTGEDTGWKYVMSVAAGTAVRFDTLRKLGGPITGGAGGVPVGGLKFDTLRKTKATFPGSAADGTIMCKFDTLRRLGAPIGDVIGTIGGGSGDDVGGHGGDQLPTFDTYRHLGYNAVNEVDTKRIVDGAEIIVPVDTER